MPNKIPETVATMLSLIITMSGCGIGDKLSKLTKNKDDSTSALQSGDPSTTPLPDDGRILTLADLEATPGYIMDPLEAWELADLETESYPGFGPYMMPSIKGAGSTSLAETENCQRTPDSIIGTWVANKVSAKIGYTYDKSECMKKNVFPSMDFINYSYVVKFYEYMTCSGADLSELNGKTASDVIDTKLRCTQMTRRVEVLNNTTAEWIDGKGHRVVRKTTGVRFIGAKNLATCAVSQAESKVTFSDDCMNVFKDSEADSESANDVIISETKKFDLEKHVYKGLIQDQNVDDNLWHTAGTVEIQKNDWAGTVTYTRGPIAPTYSLKNINTGEVKTGTRQARK